MIDLCTGAFVCPLHDGPKNDFRWGLNLYRSAKKFGLDGNLYFVFSTNNEAEKFRNLCKGGG